jgi:8-oxo-dGTP pyrophosphatase MutT (NUDIX family)
MTNAPDPGTTMHRVTARVLPVDPSGRVLLLHGWEPNNPGRTYWFTIGGALDEGEDHADAAVRELFEEVGITITRDELTAPLGVWDNAFAWGDWQVEQTETWFAVAAEPTEANFAGLDAVERDTIDRAAWWTPDDLDRDGTAVIPELTARMRAAIAAVNVARR